MRRGQGLSFFPKNGCHVCNRGLPFLKNVSENPNHHDFSKSIATHLPFKYCNTPPICIALLSVPLCSEEGEILSALLPSVSQYASHFYCSTPPIFWEPGCSPIYRRALQASPYHNPPSPKMPSGVKKKKVNFAAKSAVAKEARVWPIRCPLLAFPFRSAVR